MIQISNEACEKIIAELKDHLPRKENEQEDGTNKPTIRLGVLPEEMREDYLGFRYIFCEDGSVDGDVRLDFQDFGVLVHHEHMEEINGMFIDFRKDGLQERFDFAAPCNTDVCGCGVEHSFDNVKSLNIQEPEKIDYEYYFGKVEDEDIVSESEGS